MAVSRNFGIDPGVTDIERLVLLRRVIGERSLSLDWSSSVADGDSWDTGYVNKLGGMLSFNVFTTGGVAPSLNAPEFTAS